MIFGMILIKERRRKNRNVRQIPASPTFYGKRLADITFGRKFCCGKQYPENFARNLCGLG